MEIALKIVHVTAEFSTQISGGLGTFVDSLFSAQKKILTPVVFLLHRKPEVKQSKPTPLNEIEKFQQLLSDFDPDIVHFHDWHGAHLLEGLKRYSGVVVFTCHLPSVFNGYGEALADYRQRHRSEESLISYADAVIANSKYTLRQLSALYSIHPKKKWVVANGVADVFYGSCTLVNREDLVLAAGRLVAQKGISNFVDACRLLSEWHPTTKFGIIGEGVLRLPLQSQIEDLGLSDRFEFPGYVNQKQLAYHFSRSKVVVVPSIYEPFGLVAAEAMACGSCVVASDTGGLREVVEHGHNGLLVEVGNANAIAEAVSHLLSKSESWTVLSHRSKLSAKERFLMEDCSSRYLKIYRTIVNELPK
jgi:glycogen(starch) synthase